MTLSMF